MQSIMAAKAVMNVLFILMVYLRFVYSFIISLQNLLSLLLNMSLMSDTNLRMNSL